MPKLNVLCLVTHGVEETELVAPVDVLRRADVGVVVASMHGALSVMGSHEIGIEADVLIEDVDVEQFDALMVPGGPGVGALREDGRAADLARQFAGADKLVGAICAAPLILLDAGLLDGKQYTAHQTVRGELGVVLDGRVVIDGNLVTSRGAGTAIDFGLAMVGELCDGEKAREIAAAIMA